MKCRFGQHLSCARTALLLRREVCRNAAHGTYTSSHGGIGGTETTSTDPEEAIGEPGSKITETHNHEHPEETHIFATVEDM